VTISSFSGPYRWLSNFYGAEAMGDVANLGVSVEYDGVSYPSVENAYQAAKTSDPELRVQFVSCTAGQAKRRGNKLDLVSGWDSYKFTVMDNLLRQKFSDRNPRLKQALIDTRRETLVEGNTWHDNVWGRCECSSCGGTGANRLGAMLMQIRAELIEDMVDGIASLLKDASSISFVGSRACTDTQLKRLGMVAGWAACVGKLGVSGGCEGADQTAANKFVQYGAQANFHVHMPWPQYNSKHVVPEGCTWDCWDDKYNKASGFVIPEELRADALALALIHDKARTTRYPNLMGRNALIVMHGDLLVYAINGDSAGTTHDVNIANDIGVPTLNVSDNEVWDVVYEFLRWQRILMDEDSQG